MKLLVKNTIVSLMVTFLFTSLAMAESAPDFLLKDTNGRGHSLSNYLGKYVVLEWFNPDCPYVQKHYDSDNMQMLQRKYTGKGVVWLSIVSSAKGKQGYYSPSEYNEILNDYKAHQTALLLDHAGKVGHLYEAKTTPHMFVIDPKGEIIYSGAIDSIASANPEHIINAVNLVSKSLDQSMNGEEVEHSKVRSYGCSVKY